MYEFLIVVTIVLVCFCSDTIGRLFSALLYNFNEWKQYRHYDKESKEIVTLVLKTSQMGLLETAHVIWLKQREERKLRVWFRNYIDSLLKKAHD